jgi:hypothetical protein
VVFLTAVAAEHCWIEPRFRQSWIESLAIERHEAFGAPVRGGVNISRPWFELTGFEGEESTAAMPAAILIGASSIIGTKKHSDLPDPVPVVTTKLVRADALAAAWSWCG